MPGPPQRLLQAELPAGRQDVVKERLGHEDIRTTINVYGHLLPSVDAALVDELNGLFEAAEQEQPDNVVELPTALADRT